MREKSAGQRTRRGDDGWLGQRLGRVEKRIHRELGARGGCPGRGSGRACWVSMIDLGCWRYGMGESSRGLDVVSHCESSLLVNTSRQSVSSVPRTDSRTATDKGSSYIA